MAREKIGTVEEYDEENSVVTVHLTNSISIGDELAFLGPVAYQSEEIEKITKEGEEVEKAEEDDDVKIPTETKVRESTSVYKMI